MIGVDLIGGTCRAYFEQRLQIKVIVRRLAVSRATVRRVIRGQKTEFKCQHGVQPVPKLGEWVAVLSEMLERETKLSRRERRSTQRLFEELRGRDCDGAHYSAHRFVKTWRDERAQVPAQAFVPMSFAPDDNMKTAVEAIFVGYARQYNRYSLQMCSHHLIEPVACTPAAGWEKGQVENQVGNLRDRLFCPKPRVKSLAELIAWLADQCIVCARRTQHPEFKDRTIREAFQDERASLMELRGRSTDLSRRWCAPRPPA